MKVISLLAGVIAVIAPAGMAHAQTWLPSRGEGTVSVLFSNTMSQDHYLPDQRYDFGQINANTLLFDLTYGLTDRLTVTVGMPVVASRYLGSAPHRPVTLDDGAWHVTGQDVRFGVRYNALDGPMVVTTFAGTSVPSTDYEYYAHAAPGRQLAEAVVGLSAGHLFAEQGIVLQGSYGFTFSESELDIPRRFSLLSLETAYFVTPALRLMAITSSRLGHTGIQLTPTSGRDLPPEVFLHHDQISRESYLNVGGGAAFSLSDSIDLFGGFTTTVWGRNTHAVNRGLSLGMAWGFGRAGAPAATVAARRESALIKCLCQKAS